MLAAKTIFPLILAAMLPAIGRAGFCTNDPRPGDTRNEFQVWGGFSALSGGPISATVNRRFAVAGASYSRRCWAWNNFSVSLNAGIIPAAVVSQPASFFGAVLSGTPSSGLFFVTGSPVNGGVFTIIGSPGHPVIVPILISQAHSAYGFAVTPVGFTLDVFRDSRVYPFVQTDGGLIKSNEAVPLNVPGGTSLNFLLDLGAGVKIRTGKSRAVTVGYKWMHLSNANRTAVNPGLDNNVIFAGISWGR